MSHLTTLFVVGPEEYVEFNESLGSKAMLQHVWDHETTPLDKKDTASTTLHSSGARISPTPPPKIEFPTLKRIKGKGNHYQPTGKWFSWDELARRNPLAVNPPPSIESLLRNQRRKDDEDRKREPDSEDLGIGKAPRVEPGSWLVEKEKKPKVIDPVESNQIGTLNSKYATTTPLNHNGTGASKYASNSNTVTSSKPESAGSNTNSSTATKTPQSSKKVTSTSTSTTTSGGTSSIDALLQRVRMYSRSGNSPSPSSSPSAISTSSTTKSSSSTISPTKSKFKSHSDDTRVEESISSKDPDDSPIPSLALRLGSKVDEGVKPQDQDVNQKSKTIKKSNQRDTVCQTEDDVKQVSSTPLESREESEKEKKGVETSQRGKKKKGKDRKNEIDINPTSNHSSSESVDPASSDPPNSNNPPVKEQIKIPTGPKALQSDFKSKIESQSKKEKEKAQSSKVEVTSPTSLPSSSSSSSKASNPSTHIGSGIGAKGSTFKEELDPLRTPPTGPSKKSSTPASPIESTAESYSTTQPSITEVKDSTESNSQALSTSNSGSSSSRWAHNEDSKFKPFDKSQVRLAFKSGPNKASEQTRVDTSLPADTPKGPKADQVQVTQVESKLEKDGGRKSSTKEKKAEKKGKAKEKEERKQTSSEKEKEISKDDQLRSASKMKASTTSNTNVDSESNSKLPAPIQMERKMSSQSEVSNAETVKSSDLNKKKSRKERKASDPKTPITPSSPSSSDTPLLSVSNLAKSDALHQEASSSQSNNPQPDLTSNPFSSISNSKANSPIVPAPESVVDGVGISSSSSSSHSLSFSSNINWADDDEDDTLPDLEDWGISGINTNSSPSKSNSNGTSSSSPSKSSTLMTGTSTNGDGAPNGRQDSNGRTNGNPNNLPRSQSTGLHSDRMVETSSSTIEGVRSVNKRGSKRAGKGRGSKKDREMASNDNNTITPDGNTSSDLPPSAPMGMRIAGRASLSSNSQTTTSATTTSISNSTSDPSLNPSIPSGPRSPTTKATPYWSKFTSNPPDQPSSNTKGNNRELLGPSTSSFSRESNSSNFQKDRAPINHSRPRIMASSGGAFSRLTKGIVAVNDEKGSTAR